MKSSISDVWLVTLALFLACGGAHGLSAQREVTKTQLDAEFRETASAAISTAEAVAGDTAAFLARVQPFGPLDLMVLKATSPKQASDLRSFFLGIVGGAAQIDPAPLTNRWHCGPPCAAARRDSLVGRLAAARAVVTQLRALPQIDVVAPWPGGGFRASRLTYADGAFSLLTPSPGLGLLPWRSAAVAGDETTFAALGASRHAVEALVADLRAAGFAAVARNTQGSIRVVLTGGIGNNEAGLLFLAPTDKPPGPATAHLLDGRAYVAADAVEPGVYFYVTT